MTDETLGALLAQWFAAAASVALAVGIGAGFWMAEAINGSADERTARLFNIVCEGQQE
jgi:hypothetical protein